MKRLIILPALLLSSSVLASQPGQCGPGFDKWDLNCDGKIGYEEGMASQQAYRDEIARVHQPAHREGLPPPSEAGYPPIAKTDSTGEWKKVATSTTEVLYAGEYSLILAPSAENKVCALGTKGLILHTYRQKECAAENSHGWCYSHRWVTYIDNEKGYKAECR